MATIEKRLAALEQASYGDRFPKTIIVCYLTLGDTGPNIRRLKSGYRSDEIQEWEREPVETEEDFKERASKEVSRNAGGIAMLFQDN